MEFGEEFVEVTSMEAWNRSRLCKKIFVGLNRGSARKEVYVRDTGTIKNIIHKKN